MFNIERLELARKRRRYTGKILAEEAEISPVTLSRVVNRQQEPDEETINALIKTLGFPRDFFFQDEPTAIDASAASFRSLTAMSARERDAALAAGSLAFEVSDWVKQKFDLPEADLLDLSQERDPAGAARMLRQYWSIGERPIGNMIKLLESKGVRVFSLSENTRNVDAFSCWRDNEPYIFLNTFKTPERSRFDAAHELAHLVLHKHGGPQQGRQAEYEAQAFASSFLMPKADVVATIPYVMSLQQIIEKKSRWGVSASALSYRLHKMGTLTDWQYRTFVIQINRNFGTKEPFGIDPEKSAVWQMVLTELWKDRISRSHIATELHLPSEELEGLIFGLAADTNPPARSTGKPTLKSIG